MTVITTAICLISIHAGGVTGDVRLSSGRAGSQAVVYLEGNVRSTPLAKCVIDQRDRTFIPHISVVTVNTVVDFPNNDVVFHNVFTEYHSERFDLGMYPRGSTKRQKFDRPGLAVLLCNIHPHMGAFVMCVDTPYYAIADKKGHFSIPHVPEGEYTLRAWQESGETETKPVTVRSESKISVSTHR